MLFVIDVGNTNIVFGIYNKNVLSASFRITTEREKSADEIGMSFMQFLNYEKIEKSDIKAVVVSSVVPQIMYSLEHAIQKYLNLEPLVVGQSIMPDMKILYDNPNEVGADRIVNAVAAFNIYKQALIIIDFGTATTFCAVNSSGHYLGGIILPGVKISMEALFQRAAKLPRVEIVKPKTVIGKNTISSMQSGVLYGYAGSVDNIVLKMKKEMAEENIKVVATGGLARLITAETKTVDELNRNLTLEGLKIIYEKNYKGV